MGYEGERVGGKIQNVALDHQHDSERQTEVHVSDRERDADAVDRREEEGRARVGSREVPHQMDRQSDAERRHRFPAEPGDDFGDGAFGFRNVEKSTGLECEARNVHRQQGMVR